MLVCIDEGVRAHILTAELYGILVIWKFVESNKQLPSSPENDKNCWCSSCRGPRPQGHTRVTCFLNWHLQFAAAWSLELRALNILTQLDLPDLWNSLFSSLSFFHLSKNSFDFMSLHIPHSSLPGGTHPDSNFTFQVSAGTRSITFQQMCHQKCSDVKRNMYLSMFLPAKKPDFQIQCQIVCQTKFKIYWPAECH